VSLSLKDVSLTRLAKNRRRILAGLDGPPSVCGEPRALASDVAYLEAWALAATGGPLPWPASESLILKFVAHHLWDPATQGRFGSN
jgi:hypothetical protein